MAYLRCVHVFSLLLLISASCLAKNWSNHCEHYPRNGKTMHPEDCHKYIDCQYQKTTILSCPKGMAYDMFDKDCRKESIVRPPCPMQTGTSKVNQAMATVCQDNGLDAESTHAHPLMCGAYIKCVHGGKVSAWAGCSDGQQYDTVTKKCQDPDKVDCSLNANYFSTILG